MTSSEISRPSSSRLFCCIHTRRIEERLREAADRFSPQALGKVV